MRQHHTVFFASGSKGNEVRADGYGGFLARGYYFLGANGLNGPFANKRQADRACDAAVLAAFPQRPIISNNGGSGDR